MFSVFTNISIWSINYSTEFKMLVKNSMAYLEFVLTRLCVATKSVHSVEEMVVLNGKMTKAKN